MTTPTHLRQASSPVAEQRVLEHQRQSQAVRGRVVVGVAAAVAVLWTGEAVAAVLVKVAVVPLRVKVVVAARFRVMEVVVAGMQRRAVRGLVRLSVRQF